LSEKENAALDILETGGVREKILMRGEMDVRVSKSQSNYLSILDKLVGEVLYIN
jgi:hypothetical protein